jgi:hypothetical protein
MTQSWIGGRHSDLAMLVREWVWVERLRLAKGCEFDSMCAEIGRYRRLTFTEPPLSRAVDEERGKRGLGASPSKAQRDREEAALWEAAAATLPDKIVVLRQEVLERCGSKANITQRCVAFVAESREPAKGSLWPKKCCSES